MEGELKEIKSTLRSLVVSSPAALDAQTLLRDYRRMMGCSLPITRFRYRDPILFLKEQCADCFVFQGSANNPSLTLIVPDSLKHIDKFVQKQKTAMKGKMKRRSIPESSIKAPANNLITATFNNKNNRKKFETFAVENKKENVTNFPAKPSVSNGSLTTHVPASNVNNKENVINNHTTNQSATISETEERPASSLPRFLRKRLPILESLNDLHIEDDNETTTIDDNKSGRDNSDSGRHTACSSSSSKQLQIETLKREIFEIVDEHPDGVLCADLIRLYRQRHGRELQYTRLGHMSLLAAAVALGLRAAAAAGDYRVGRATPPPAARPAPRAARSPRLRSRELLCAEDALPGVPVDKDAFPEDCMHYLDVIPSVSVADLAAGARCDVLPAEVYSPSHVWLIRLGERHYSAMNAVMDAMLQYYRRGPGAARALAPAAVRVGQYVACLYEGDWHRAIIARVLDCDTVKVRHVDYGTVQSVSARSLRPLLKTFAALPAQAVRARLAGIRPARRARRWQHAAALSLLQLLRDTPHVAQVQARRTSEDERDILDVFLVNTSGAEDVCVNEELVRQGHAEPASNAAPDDESWLLPRFAALETGATPSLHDCLTYLRDGIELDYVDDYRRHVAPLLPPPAHKLPSPAPSPEPSPAPSPDPSPAPSPDPSLAPSPEPPPPTPSPPPPQPPPPRSPSPAPPRPAMRYPPRPAPPALPTPRLTFDAVQMSYGGPQPPPPCAMYPDYMPVAPPPGFGWQHAAPRPAAPQWVGGPGPAAPQWVGGPGPAAPQWAGGAGPAAPQWPGPPGPPGALSAAEQEVLSLVARVRPALAQRYVADRLGARAPTPLNPLAPEFYLPRY